jgi:hypothetical protein
MTAPRRTFSGRGRKARGLVPLVEGTGRVVRPPREETVAEVVSIVLAQPHRRGFEDARSKWHLVTPAGRMIEAGCCPDIAMGSLHEAAKRYLKAFEAYRSAVTATRRPLAVTTGRTPLDDPERELKERRDAERAWGDVSRALRDKGGMVEKACQFVILDYHPDDWQVPFWCVHATPIGLRALVQFYKLEGDGR